MDRQAVLEQKRQRLQELKQRRSQIPSIDVTQPNLSVDARKPVIKKEFSVQVSTVSTGSIEREVILPEVPVHETPNQRIRKFDKVVQTNSELLIEFGLAKSDKAAPVAIHEQEETTGHKDDPKNLSNAQILNATFEELSKNPHSGFNFSNLRLGIRESLAHADEANAPFTSVSSINGFLDRPVIATSTTKEYPYLILVAYGKPRVRKIASSQQLSSSDGLAIIYNRQNHEVFPEFFLQCSSCISTIIFDDSNPFRVIAGLVNGRIVVWDLLDANPSEIATLPTLQTTTIASITDKAEHKFEHHTSPILFLQQLGADGVHKSSVVSICSNGILNLWSPNFLAYPKMASIQLSQVESSSRRPFYISSALKSNKLFKVAEKRDYKNPLEYSFLDSTLISTKGGSIYRLVNDKERHFKQTELAVQHGVKKGPYASEVFALAELNLGSIPLLLSVHANWTLQLWDLTTNEPLLQIHTTTLIKHVCVRPNHPSQFLTIGEVSLSTAGLVAEFWDIKVSVVRPILNIPTDHKYDGVAKFSDEGNELIFGFDDGEINVYKIDEGLLNANMGFEVQALEEGIDKFLADV